MLISPPFIPSPVAGESDDAFLNRAMQGGVPGDGGFPLSFDLNWHGGIHLTAPSEDGTVLPVRAIADGTIAYFRQPLGYSADIWHPLNYGAAWTDNGCIVLRHETDIGDGAEAKVIFYSIYQHLSAIDLAGPSVGKKIYRKDILGQAGKIYGSPNKIHFEIIASETKRLLGRSTTTLEYLTNSGRTDSCWGDMHFHLPPEALCYKSRPEFWHIANNNSEPVSKPSTSLFVRMRYDKGQCTLTTFTETGDNLGDRQEDQNFEYNLYDIAKERYPACPSAGYELLRFGRVLGPDALQPAIAAHWRQIKINGVDAWVNLNASTITKFSDADFPHWRGWKLIDDDTDDDSHCQSALIRELLGLDSDPLSYNGMDAISIANSSEYDRLTAEGKDFLCDRYVIERQRNMTLLSKDETQKKLKRCVFKFPSEWSKDDFDARYGWLFKVAEGGPMPQEHYDKLKAHQQTLAFWEDAALEGIEAKHWHFPPKEFIHTFRKCGWLSVMELAQLVPKNVIRKPGSHNSNTQGVWEQPNITIAMNFIRTHSRAINRALQKFLITTPIRQACFFGNSIQETGWFRFLQESNGTTPDLHLGWYGRGFLQLTNPNGAIAGGNNNYYKYFKFLGKSPIVPPGPAEIQWRNEIGINSFHACHSAGVYWIWTNKSTPTQSNPSRPQVDNTNVYADISSVNERKEITTNAGRKVWYYNQSFVNCSTAVNYPAVTGTASPNMNGLVDRSVAYVNALIVLLDRPEFVASDGSSTDYPENFSRREI